LTSFGYRRQLVGVTQTLSPPESRPGSARCLNCAAALNGPFCSQCGQRVVLPRPTTRELVGDAYDELVGWDGKFAGTIRLLLTRPGELTAAVIGGQRARYVGSVRLYLMCSVVFFLLQTTVPFPDVDKDFEIGFGVGVGGTTDQTPGEAALGKAVTSGIATLTVDERAALDREIDDQPWVIRPMVRAMAEDYEGLMRRAENAIPRVLFFLIPALALVLGVFYRGRHYPEHMYFATHFGAFVFVVLTLETFVEFTRSLPAIAVTEIIGAIVIVVYGVVAQRRVYGGTWLATGAKAIGVAVIYGTLWSVAVLAVTVWASRTG
jgi:hypothetical protein